MSFFPKNTSANLNKNNDVNNTIYIGKVVSLSDNIYDDHIIKVRLRGIDDNKISDKELPSCHPFLPKYLNIIPKKGEWVKILFWNSNNRLQNREYIGPIISQVQKLKKEDSESAFSSQQSFSPILSDISDKVIAESKGIYPEKEDIAIQGRDNTNIIQREREVVIRAGIHQIKDNLKLNQENPAFYHVKQSEDGSVTTANIIANKINFITHNGSPTLRTISEVRGEDIIDLYSGKISDKTQEQINKNTHSIPYGDKLVEFIELVKKYMIEHSHPYPGGGINKNSSGWDVLQKILTFNLNEGTFRTKNIKIN